MVKQLKFLDDCRSKVRLDREYIKTAPAGWTQVYEAPYDAYKFTPNPGVNFCTLIGETDLADFELNVLMKATNIDAMMGAVLRKERSSAWGSGEFYLWCTGGTFVLVFTTIGGATPILVSVAYAIDITKWHHLRARVNGRYVQGKIWPNDEAEPPWMIEHSIGYKEMRENGVIALKTTVREVYFTNVHWTFQRNKGRATVTR